MGFCYALVSRGNTPLCQHCAVPGNFDLYVQKVFPVENLEEGITIAKVDDYVWGIRKDSNGLNVLCVVKKDYENSILIKTIDEIRNRFVRINGAKWKESSPYSLQNSFEPQLIDISKSISSSSNSLLEIIPPSLVDVENISSSEMGLLDNEVGYGKRHKKRMSSSSVLILSLIFIICIIIVLLATLCPSFNLITCVFGK